MGSLFPAAHARWSFVFRGEVALMARSIFIDHQNNNNECRGREGRAGFQDHFLCDKNSHFQLLNEKIELQFETTCFLQCFLHCYLRCVLLIIVTFVV